MKQHSIFRSVLVLVTVVSLLCGMVVPSAVIRPAADTTDINAMLGVAIQYSASSSTVSAKTDLRLISSVDSLSYQKVWFEVTFGKLDGTALTADKSFSSPDITVVYDTICTSSGQVVTDHKPSEVFSPNSRYFFTFTIDEIESKYFAMPVRVQACAMTEEGQTVKGAELQFRLDENMLSESILNTGIVGHETLYDNKYQAWPTVCKDENGVLYAVCSNRLKHIDPFGKNCLYKSTDGGVTWDAGTVINDTPYFDDRDCGIVYLGGGKMVMSYFNHKAANYVMNLNSDGSVKDEYTVGSAFYKEWHQWCDWQEIANWGVSPSDEKYDEIVQQIEDTKTYLLSVASGAKADKRGSYLRVSNDYGATWSESFKVEISAPHGPTLMQDGQTLLYVGKESYSGLAGFHAIQYSFTDASGNVLTKTDIQNPNKQITGIKKGNTSQLPLPEGMTISQCWEPHGIQLQDGTILAAMRVQPTSNTLHLEVYLTRGIVQQNGSIEWSTPVHIAEGQIGAPAHLLQASDGTLIVTYGRRVEPTGILARVSQDGGLTWGKEIVLSRPANTADDDLGYSATVELSKQNGELTFLTVYYQHYNGEKMPSILYTTWKIPASNS